MARKTLLVNWVYYRPVGHIVEGLKFAAGFHSMNPNLEIHIALSSRSAYELAKGCPWIKETYPIDPYELAEKGGNATCLKGMPRDWDYMASDYRAVEDVKWLETKGYDHPEERGMLNYLKITETEFHTRIGSIKHGQKQRLPKGLKYKKTKLTLQIPRRALHFAKRYQYNGIRLCIIPGGSAGRQFAPSTNSWATMIDAIKGEFPKLKIYITGVSRSEGKRTYTSAFTKKQIASLTKIPGVVDCYDIGLWNQIALMHTCDVLLAPHTGFAFVASCVGTPWLVLSGGDWPEYLFNHTSFYSVLPREKGYPYVGRGRYTKHGDEGKRYPFDKIPPFTPANIEKKIPDLLRGMHLLLNNRFTYRMAIRTYRENIRRLGLEEKKFHFSESF